MNANKITPAMKKALRAVHEAGDAVIQPRGVLAAGEWLPFEGRTFLRLAGAGLVSVTGNRIALTEAGTAMAIKLPAFDGMPA